MTSKIQENNRSVFSSDYRVFIDTFMVFGTGIGLPRSTARILAYLLICTPSEQTSAQLKEALGLSVGSTSIGTRMLTEMGLVKVTKLGGDRRHYYYLVPDGFEKLTRKRIETFNYASDVAQIGLKLDQSNGRLIAMRELYMFLANETQDTMSRFNRA